MDTKQNHLPDNVLEFLKLNMIFKYTVMPDMSLDILQSVNINHLKEGRIPHPIYRVRGRFSCANRGLTTLKNCPQIVYQDCNLRSNELTSLEYAPKKAKEFMISGNKIKNLINSPDTRKLVAQNCGLESLEGLHDNVRYLSITENPLVKDLSFLKRTEMNKLILSNTGIERLDQFLVIDHFLNLKETSLKFINPDLISFTEGATFSLDTNFLRDCENGINFLYKHQQHLCHNNNSLKLLLAESIKINEERKTNILLTDL